MIDAKKYLGEMLSERYLIKREIGRGASSVVFYAEDMLTPGENGKPVPVAIKMLDKDSGEYKLNKRSFETEIRAVVNMPTNPHVVDIHDVSFRDEEHYIVMEYVRGKTLRDLITEKGGTPFSAKEIVSVSLQILQALRNAHEAGVVHRDIKPQNILVQASEEAGAIDIPGGKEMPYIKLADFGIALLPDDDLMKMKDKGVGTLHYVSPEQASGGVIDHRSDLYSLGVVMYEMATAHVPFDAKSATGIIQMHQLDEPFRVRSLNKDIPLKLDQIIYSAMQKNPASRFRDAAAMEKKLKEVLRDLTPGETKDVEVPMEKKAVVVEGDTWRKAKEPKEKSPKPRKARSASRTPRFLVPVLAAALAVGLVAAGLFLWLDGRGAVEVTIPGLVGSAYAETNAYPDRIAVSVIKESNEEIPEGVIFHQSPGGGVVISVKKDDTVQLTLKVSTGPATMEFSVPEIARQSSAVLEEYLKNYRDAEGNFLLSILRLEEAEERDERLPAGYVLGITTDTGVALNMEGDEIRTKKSTNLIVKVNPAPVVTFEIPAAYRASGEMAKSYVNSNYPFFDVTVKTETVQLLVSASEDGEGGYIYEYHNLDELPAYCFKNGELLPNGSVAKATLEDGTELSLDGMRYEALESGVALTLLCVKYNEVLKQ